MEKNPLLENYLKRLRLPAMNRSYLQIAREASERNQSYIDYLLALTEHEIIQREQASLQRRLKQAQFPYIKTLDNFDFSAIPSLNKNKVLMLDTCEFIAKKETVILCGNADPTT